MPLHRLVFGLTGTATAALVTTPVTAAAASPPAHVAPAPGLAPSASIGQLEYGTAPAPAECLPFLHTGTQHAAQIWASLRADPSLPRDNATRVAAMAAAVRANGGHLVLVTPPFTRFYRDSPAMRAVWALHDRQTRTLVARTGVTYLDFRDFFPPSMYERENHLFRDNAHLTSTGAALFSRALRTKLEHLGLLPG